MNRRGNGAVGALLLVALAGCGAFAGPATAPSESDYFACGDVKCRFGLEECSTGKPERCIPAWTGAARDAGAAPTEAGRGTR